MNIRQQVEHRVERLRAEFAAGELETRLGLLRPAHTRDRFENYDPHASTLSDADARLLIANEEGYAYWSKYDSFLHLAPAVQIAIAAVRKGDLETLRAILDAEPGAANPAWVPGFAIPKPIPNDSIPLFCVAEGFWRKTNTQGNEYALTQALLVAGGEVDIEGGLPLGGAVSFQATRVVEALLDGGAEVDGVDHDGAPMAYALHFAQSEIAELLASRGASLDLRFAAGLGRLQQIRDWFHPDGSLKEGAGALADPYALERKWRGGSAQACERTPANILSQAVYFACLHKKLEAATLLLQQGAAINAIIPGLDSQATVLHHIATQDETYEPVLQFLLDQGADHEIRDHEHHTTPATWARHFNRSRFAALLDSRRLGHGGR